MPRSILCAALMIGAAACGPKHAGQTGTGTGGGSSAGSGGATGADAGSQAPRPTPLSRAECEQMIDHVLEIGMAQQRAQKPAEYVPTPEQVAQIRERLVIDQLSACLAWPRPQWQCVMASATVDKLYTCAEGPTPAAPK